MIPTIQTHSGLHLTHLLATDCYKHKQHRVCSFIYYGLHIWNDLQDIRIYETLLLKMTESSSHLRAHAHACVHVCVRACVHYIRACTNASLYTYNFCSIAIFLLWIGLTYYACDSTPGMKSLFLFFNCYCKAPSAKWHWTLLSQESCSNNQTQTSLFFVVVCLFWKTLHIVAK